MQDSELANLKLTLEQCESEAAVLGRQLQLQTEELEQVKQGRHAQEEAQKLLEKANRDIVSHVEVLPLSISHVAWSPLLVRYASIFQRF